MRRGMKAGSTVPPARLSTLGMESPNSKASGPLTIGTVPSALRLATSAHEPPDNFQNSINPPRSRIQTLSPFAIADDGVPRIVAAPLTHFDTRQTVPVAKYVSE